jgi:hypothetical protein
MPFGTTKQIAGFQDVFGGKNFNTVDYSGPTSYFGGAGSAGGDKLDPKAFGAFNDIIAVIGTSSDQTGTYFVHPRPVNNGVTQWYLRWFVVSTGVEAANGTNLSGFTLKISIIGS